MNQLSTGAILCDKSNVLSTGAMLRRQKQSWRMSQLWFVDRSKSNVDRSEVLPTGASLYGQEQSWRPFQPLERLERPVWAAWGAIWAAWEPGKPVWARLTWPQDGVLSTRAMPTGGRFCRQAHCFVDKGIPGSCSSSWGGLRSLFGRPGGLSGQPGSLGNLSGRPGGAGLGVLLGRPEGL